MRWMTIMNKMGKLGVLILANLIALKTFVQTSLSTGAHGDNNDTYFQELLKSKIRFYLNCSVVTYHITGQIGRCAYGDIESDELNPF